MGRDSDCGNEATLKRVPLRRKKLRPISRKFADFRVPRRDFPQFSVTLPSESLISGKACPRSNFACRLLTPAPSWVRLVPAIVALPDGTKNVDARDKAGHDDVDAFTSRPHIRPLTPMQDRMRPRVDASVN
jgi:hypothetical protein